MDKKERFIERLRKRKSVALSSRAIRYLSNFVKNRRLRHLERQNKIMKVTSETFFDKTMNLNLPELVSKSIYLYSYFEPDTSQAMIKLINEGDSFADIGAHIGYYSLLASEIVGAQGKVYSFEPTPSTLHTLLMNTKNENNVKVENMALWSEKGSLEFHDFGEGNSVFNSFYNARSESDKTYQSIEVLTDTIDNLFNGGRKKLNVIKIDAESAELEILKGARNLLKSLFPKIILEIGDFEDPNVPLSNEIILFLEDLGYRIYIYKNDSFVELEKQDRYPSMNIYALKEGWNK